MKVYISGGNDIDIECIHKMFSSVKIEPYLYQIIDIDKVQDFPIDDNNMFVFGKSVIKSVVNKLVEAEILPPKLYKGSPLVDPESQFFFYAIGLTVSEIMAKEDNKLFTYKLLLDLASYYKEWFPINDELPNMLSENKVDSPLNAVETDNSSLDTNISPGQISTYDLVTKLVEMVDFSDVNLGKSLSKFDKIQLETSSGITLNVLPTFRENSKDEDTPGIINITYKDLLSLLKVVLLTGTKSIEFFK